MAAVSAVLGDPDLLEAVLATFSQEPYLRISGNSMYDSESVTMMPLNIKALLHCRCVSPAWRQAARKPLLTVGVLFTHFVVKMIGYHRHLEVVQASRDDLTTASDIGKTCSHLNMVPTEQAGACWIVQRFELGSINSVVADAAAINKRRQLIAALIHFRSQGLVGPFAIVTLPSSLRRWEEDLAAARLAYTRTHVDDDMEMWRCRASERQRLLSERGVFLLSIDSIPTARSDSSGKLILDLLHWKHVTVDVSDDHSPDIPAAVESVRDALNLARFSKYEAPTLNVLATTTMPSDFHSLFNLSCSLPDSMLNDLTRKPFHQQQLLRAKVDKYSFGDAELRRWAIDELLVSYLREVLQLRWLRRESPET